ncbi:hypothetical protein IV203_010462 [Nitzschia inconspicua]|uniref:Uncharacterized protein n=1 Tax=Nitzschia inconspicua TaxID=303405 RepID=A0A9K3PKI4_9STRA|nr:hypothetical protein IV203_010462 [Nitzschia inconspicua]
MVSKEEEETTIAMAIKMLEKHIRKLVQKSGPRQNNIPTKLQRLLDHTRHLLLDLFQKRLTLKAFLQWFQGEWSKLEVHLADNPVLILQNALQHYLRCQDGLVLLTSGECRHASDIQEAQRTRYPSRLPSLKERNDGYTKLYTGEFYSGTGWDEFHNEQVGIKVLLKEALQNYHKTPWEYLENRGATDLLDSIWDQHESHVKELQQQLQSLKQRMLSSIQQKLQPRNLKFATQDKMERLSLVVKSQTIDLQRRGNAFQIQGLVLPSSKQSVEDWMFLGLPPEKIFVNNGEKNKGPNGQPKRRRLVIESSSDSEGDENDGSIEKNSSKKPVKANNPNCQSSSPISNKIQGIVVSVKETSTSFSTSPDVALNQIKIQMGVNARDLEDARESLEVEQFRTEEGKVVRLKKVLQRALSRTNPDDEEIWDARECLRLAHMEAGNFMLWETTNGGDKARDHFEAAKALVEQQQETHLKMAQRSDFDSTTWKFLNRNLYYLLGQATVNVGISIIEAVNKSLHNRGSKVLKAVPKLQAAKECASKIRSNIDSTAPFSLEEAQDLLKADQLESLAGRWIGKAHWIARQEDKAVETLQTAASLINEEKVKRMFTGLEEDVLDLAAECLYALHMLVDVACSQLEKLVQSSAPKGDALVEVVKQTLHDHNKTLEFIHQNNGNVNLEDFLLEKDLPTSVEITNHLDSILKWWNGLKEQRHCPLLVDTNSHQQRHHIQRDLSSATTNKFGMVSDQAVSYHSIPSWGSSQGRRQSSQRPTKAPSQNSFPEPISDPFIPPITPPTDYRLWGDKLFWVYYEQKHQKVANKSSLPYPSCAPPFPEEFQTPE